MVAMASLALGIGANSTIFSLADGLLLRPLAVADAGEIVTLVENWLTERENFGPLRAGNEKMVG